MKFLQDDFIISSNASNISSFLHFSLNFPPNIKLPKKPENITRLLEEILPQSNKYEKIPIRLRFRSQSLDLNLSDINLYENPNTFMNYLKKLYEKV